MNVQRTIAKLCVEILAFNAKPLSTTTTLATVEADKVGGGGGSIWEVPAMDDVVTTERRAGPAGPRLRLNDLRRATIEGVGLLRRVIISKPDKQFGSR